METQLHTNVSKTLLPSVMPSINIAACLLLKLAFWAPQFVYHISIIHPDDIQQESLIINYAQIL